MSKMMTNSQQNHALKLIQITMILLSIVASLFYHQNQPVSAYSLRSDIPERKAQITISYTTYEWWLLSWESPNIICQVFVEHENWPEYEEVELFCGQKIAKDWRETSPCIYSEDITEPAECPGLYIHLAGAQPGERQIEIDLLPPEVLVDIADCDLQPPENRCNTRPKLHLVGIEPLPNEYIINIQGYVGNESFSCQGSECTVPLPATGINGTQVSFWADSSFGDSTEVYTAQVRVVPWGDFTAPEVTTDDHPQWYVDIISTQYMGNVDSTCSQIWSAFPPIGGPPAWLTTPEHPDALISDQPYYYLAGSLISQGFIDASECDSSGLQSTGYANQCGLEAAREMITDWQNQFDSEIIRVAKETGVPAQLMKNIFSRESQFWPGFSISYKEAGLGHLSDLGADTVLLWNPSFFSQFCPLILDSEICHKGFGNLDLSQQEMLRGALVQKVSAACPECPLGIDLRQAQFSISIFARSLLANCEQVGQILYNTTRQTAGEVSQYDDLWRFTLVNYNAGPGCLGEAIEKTYDNNHPINWESVIQFLEPGGCQASIVYVEDISYMPGTADTTTPENELPESQSTEPDSNNQNQNGFDAYP